MQDNENISAQPTGAQGPDGSGSVDSAATAGPVGAQPATPTPVPARPVPTPPAIRSTSEGEPASPRVVAALAVLDQLETTELSAHPDVYDRIHGELRSALAEIDRA